MRILLVVYDEGSYIHCFPQGTAYIAAALLKEGFAVEIYSQDRSHHSEEDLTRHLDKNRYDMVGVGVIGGYYQYRKLLKISEAINASKHRPFYVIGGHGPSPEPEYFLSKTGADAVVIGEGEVTICEIAKAIASKGSLARVEGIAFRGKDGVVVNKRRKLVRDIDTLPFPAYDLFPIDYYRLLRETNCSKTDFVMPLLSSRGCPFKCVFCYRMDEGIRLRDKDMIVEEMRLLKEKYGINFILFYDELLMISAERTIELCEAFIKSGLGMRWSCNGRLNYARRDMLELMKKAGCVFINYGIEALDDDVLRKMKKALTVSEITKGVEATLEAGISPGLNVIFGNIGDNKETLRKGVEFLLKYDDGAQMRTIRPVTPYPGSELYEYSIKKGLLKDCGDFYEKRHTNSDLVSVNFTDMSDEEFHSSLLEANTQLMQNYFNKKLAFAMRQATDLYINKDTSFRGFRQS